MTERPDLNESQEVYGARNPLGVLRGRGPALYLAISDEPEADSVELSPNITAELNAAGELIGIEILNASTYLLDSILDSAEAKMLQLAERRPA